MLVQRGTNVWPYIGDVHVEFLVQRETDDEYWSLRFEMSIVFFLCIQASCISWISDELRPNDESQDQRETCYESVGSEIEPGS